jgi:hypothetical protein
MNEERLQILRMVQEGKVSPEEAAKLLEAVEQPDGKGGPRQKPKHVRIVIQEDRRTHTVTIGLGMAKWFLTLPWLTTYPSIDRDHLLAEIERGTIGKVFEAEEGTDRFEIWLEP